MPERKRFFSLMSSLGQCGLIYDNTGSLRSMKQNWLIHDNAGSVEGGAGYFLVVLGQYGAVLVGP